MNFYGFELRQTITFIFIFAFAYLLSGVVTAAIGDMTLADLWQNFSHVISTAAASARQ